MELEGSERLLEEAISYYEKDREYALKNFDEFTNNIVMSFPPNLELFEEAMNFLSKRGNNEKAIEYTSRLLNSLDKRLKEKMDSGAEEEVDVEDEKIWHSNVTSLFHKLSDYKKSEKRATKKDLETKIADVEEKLSQVSDQVDSAKVRESKVAPEQKTGKEPKVKPPKGAKQEYDIRPSIHSAHDVWVTEDTLGYKVYSTGVYTFLTHPKTKPPLTISIQAPWGGGKTSIMRMIQKELDPEGVDKTSDRTNEQQKEKKIAVKDIREELEIITESETYSKESETDSKEDFEVEQKPSMLTIWFNAWKYQDTEQIWSGLAEAIISQFSERLNPTDQKKFLLELNLRRTGKEKILKKINERVFNIWWRKIRKWSWTYLTGIGATTVWFFLSNLMDYGLYPFFEQNEELGIIGPMVFTVAGATLIAFQRNEAAEEVNEEDANEVLGEFVQVPDYRAKLGFLHHVDADIRRVLSIIKKTDPNMKLVVFIDDLDRCSPSSVADVFEGINMFISAEYKNCFFIIGMDIEIVAAALEKSHSGIIEKMPMYSRTTPIGWRFMDKFVQMPIIIPPPHPDNVRTYVSSLITPLEKNSKQFELAQFLASKELDAKAISNPKKFSDYVKTKFDKEIRDEDQNIILNQYKVIRAKEKTAEIIQNVIKAKDEYSDENPLVQEQVAKAVLDFSSNPREMKRFLNVLRFQFFLRDGRRRSNMLYPTPDQVRRWIVLTMKWPQFVLWLHRNSNEISFEKSPKDKAAVILDALEKNSNNSFADWRKMLESILKIDSEYENNNITWINDENLQKFFQQKVGLLSKAKNTGLY